MLLILTAALGLAADSAAISVRGRLTHREGKPPAVETADHKLIAVDGDKDSRGVLNDKRLAGAEMELRGHFTGPDQFVVDPIHTRGMHVHRDGKKLLITYWCDLCAIRTYTPGICWCCQQETEIDLREKLPE